MFGRVIGAVRAAVRVARCLNYYAGGRQAEGRVCPSDCPASITVYTTDGVERLSRRVDA